MPAFNSNNLFKPNTGALLVAPVGTAFPTSSAGFFTATVTGFTTVGYRSSDAAFDLQYDGGDITTDKVYEAPAGVRTTVASTTWFFDATLLQWESTVFGYYFGGSGTTGFTGSAYAYPTSPSAQEFAMIARFTDGPTTRAFAASRVSVIKNGNLTAPAQDGGDFWGLPVRFTLLTATTGNTNLFEII